MSGGKKQTIGYKYYLGAHIGICHGPIDAITQIQVDKRVAWEGLAEGGPITISAPELFGGEKREGGVSGVVDIEMGASSQTKNTYLQSQLGTDIPAYRGVSMAVLNQCYMGNNPYLKPWKFRASRVLTSTNGAEQWNISKAPIVRDAGGADNGEPFSRILDTYTYHWPLDDPDRGATVPAEFHKAVGGAFTLEPSTGIGDAWDSGAWGDVDTSGIDFGDFSLCADRSMVAHSLGVLSGFADIENFSPSSDVRGFHHTAVIYNDGNDPVYLVGVVQRFTLPQPVTDVTTTVNPRVTVSYSQANNRVTFTGSLSGDNPSVSVDLTGAQKVLVITITFPAPSFSFIGNNGSGFPQFTMTYNYTCRVNGVASETLSQTTSVVTCDVGTVPIFLDTTDFNAIRGGGATWLGLGIDYGDNKHDEVWTSIENGGCTGGGCSDMNPAHIIRECLTDTNWGMGYSSSDVDEASFSAAADTLYSEGMGISILWEKSQPIEDFIGVILSHIDAVVYVSRTTGKFVLKLIRDDASSPITLDESNVSSVTNARRPTISELTNSVSVVYWNPVSDENESLTVHNEALRQIQGVEISTTVQYPGFTNKDVASRVAIRDLKALSTPLLSCEVVASRSAADLNVGDVFYLDWPDLSINTTLMRVNEIDYGDGVNNSISISAVQDVFSTPTVATIGANPSGWIDPSAQTPDESIARVVEETPYYLLAREVGETQANSILTADNDAGFLLVSAGRQNAELNASVFVDSGAGYTDSATLDFHPYALVTSNIAIDDTVIDIASGVDMDLVTGGTLAQIGNELVRVDSLDVDGSGNIISATVGRGVLDTVPQEHIIASPSETYITFIDDFAVSDDEQYTAAESIDVKIRPVQSQSILPLADATEETVVMDSRAIRPYPPGNLKVDTVSYPDPDGSPTVGWTADHTITWAHRDRLQQTDGLYYDYTEGNIGPESGTTYRIDVYSTLIDTTDSSIWWTDNVGSVVTYTMGSESPAIPSPPANTDVVNIKVTSVRDGYDSWQSPIARLSYTAPPVTDANFSDVSLLLHFNGTDGSTTFTDSSANAQTVTLNGDVQIDTADSKFGGASALFDNTGDFITLPNNALNVPESGDFTIEAFTKVSTRGNVIYSTGNTQASDGFLFTISSTDGLQVFGNAADIVAASGTYPLNEWVHVALTREGTTARVFINGALAGSGTMSGTYSANANIYIGNRRFGADTTDYYDGWIDEFRFTKGVARYTAAFTAPIAAFPNS